MDKQTLNISKKNQLDSLNTSLQELVQEAKHLFAHLDIHSTCIRALEKELQKVNANFPFKLKIKQSEASPLKTTQDRHKELMGDVHGYFTQISWFLAWEEDDLSKCYRLFLIAEEIESVLFDFGENIQQTTIFSSQNIVKKPLIECDLQSRLQYSEFLISFVIAFKDHLKKSRLAIERNELPF